MKNLGLLLCLFGLVVSVSGVDAQNVSGNFPSPITFPGRADVRTYGAVCNGSTDDASAIQAAVTASAARSEVVIPSTGNACMVGSTISVPSNSHIRVDGTIKLLAAKNVDVFLIATSAANIAFDGYGIIDGNKANQTAIGGGIDSVAASNVTVRDLTIQNTYNWPINIVGTNGCFLENLNIINGGNSPEFAAESTNCWAYGLHISGITDLAFAFYGGVTHSGIIGGNVIGTIGVLNDSAQPTPSHDIVISGVTQSGAQGAGIEVYNNGGTGPSYLVSIVGNILSGNGQGNNGIGGIQVNNGSQIYIGSNQISKDGNGNLGATGIIIQGTDTNIDVNGNAILDEGIGSTGSGVGISTVATCTRCKFRNNTITDDQGSPTTAYGIAGVAGSVNEFSWNSVEGTIGAPYNITFVGDSVVNVLANNGITIVSAANAGSVSISTTTNGALLHSSGIGSYTVNLPANPPTQQIVRITCDGAIGALTVSPAAGQTIYGAPTACAMGGAYAWQFAGPFVQEWFPIQ